MRLSIPTSYRDITVGQLQDITRLKERSIERVKYLANFVSILCKIDYKDAAMIPIIDLVRIETDLMWIYSEPKKVNVKKFYRLGSRIYKPCLNLSKTNASQFTLAKTLLDKGNTDISKIIAIYMIPLFSKHSNDVYERACIDVEKHLNVEDAYALNVFFCEVLETLTTDIQIYTIEQGMKTAFKTLHLNNIGDGL